MKNQYFGDINDYRKYGLLRCLSDRGRMKTSMCWMLTENDKRTDGKFTDYLSRPETFRSNDPELFDHLHQAVSQDIRHVSVAQDRNIIPAAHYYSDLLRDDSKQRQQFFEGFLSTLPSRDLVFFDPDNGLEVKSVKYGNRGSSRYLYWGEVAQTFKEGASILIYQHFPRIKREVYIPQQVNDLQKCTNSEKITVFKTEAVAFFLVAQNRHNFENQIDEVKRKWDSHIEVMLTQGSI